MDPKEIRMLAAKLIADRIAVSLLSPAASIKVELELSYKGQYGLSTAKVSLKQGRADDVENLEAIGNCAVKLLGEIEKGPAARPL